MTILDFFKTVHPSVLAAKMIFRHLQEHYPVQKIADIADTSSGGTPSRGMVEYYNGDIPWVKSGELKDGLITKCDEYISELGLKNSSAKLFPKGTLLVAMYGANIGKTGVLDFDASTNQAVCAIFPKVKVSKDYLFWYFKQQRIDFIANGKGGAQPNISQTIIKKASIVVPDEKAQNNIVEFLNDIEQGKGVKSTFFIPEVLKDVEQIYKYKNSYVALSDSFTDQLTQLENLNQAILQEAVQGKLVKQNPDDEPASELLKHIKAEKLNSSASSGRRKKEKPLPPIKPEEIPFDIPESWVWCRLGDAVDLKRGKSKHRPRNDNKLFLDGVYPFIQTGDVSKAKNNNDLITTINGYYNDFGLAQSEMQPKGSLCITIAANIAECGFLDFDACVPDSIVCLIAIDKSIENFVYHYLKLAKADLERFAPATAQKNINLGILNDLLIPLPPLSEQKRIVAEIEKQLAKTKQLKEHIIANQQATEQLLKALLHQAFEVEEVEKEVGKLKGKVAELDNHTVNWNNLAAEPIESYAAYPKNNIQDIDWEMAMMVACMKNKLGVTYGDVGLQKNVFNTNIIQPIFSKQYAFANSNFGTYCHELKEDLKRNPYLTVQKVANNKEVYIVNPKYNKQVLDKISEPANIEFVQTLNRMLSTYEHPFINKETDKIELYNTVLKVALDKDTRDIDIIYQGMKDWTINQPKYKTKAEKFTKPDAERMLVILIEKKVL